MSQDLSRASTESGAVLCCVGLCCAVLGKAVVGQSTKKIEKNLFDLSSEEDDSEDEHTNNLLSCMLMADKRKHIFWISNHLVERKQFGEFHKLIPVLSDEQFKNYFRLSRAQFVEIHELIRFEIIKLNTNYRESVTTEERLGVCLRFLATGDSYKTIGYSFRLGERTVSKIVNEVCSSLWSQLQPTFMKMPDQESWKAYELEFRERWQFPKCVGAIDGKHVVIKAPPNSGSSFFNYKKTFSVVLMAIASANYQLIAVDIGSSGRFSDGGIFADSPIGRSVNRTQSGHAAPHDIACLAAQRPSFSGRYFIRMHWQPSTAQRRSTQHSTAPLSVDARLYVDACSTARRLTMCAST
ncbi:uncharacterized protein LOC126747069 [Anthonomus grandis grandis]|uniref:uncharacterized protein LOC126747069 n=1 Tax=Anthonomus grandis grandis TaxID=2921223 RepID=UPI0021659B71|nr:uncharacterized protein LOC126747069 [Anthonomus grandis grandis]